ncbi:MAG: PIN domain-containing protein [Acidobacteria bacterium]|nr:PIN domain-containing protein [Acidobacteriota bacterium]
MFALDSNTVIHAFQGKGAVAARLTAIAPSQIAIPAVALYEVQQGVMRSQREIRRRRQLAELLSVCRVLPFDDRAALLAAAIQVDLERSGLQIGPLDTLIAATAMAHGATLVTHNAREFVRVKGLLLEDWFD